MGGNGEEGRNRRGGIVKEAIVISKGIRDFYLFLYFLKFLFY
jgi:hypothetical protein